MFEFNHETHNKHEYGNVPAFVFFVLFVVVLFSGCSEPGQNSQTATTSLAASDESVADSLRYDQVTWLCTHNAFNASEAGFKFANQTHDIPKQLADGVDALMLDVWPGDGDQDGDGEIILRHGDTVGRWLGQRPLEDALTAIRQHLKSNPDAIVTLIFESYVSAAQVAKAFETSGLVDYCHVQDPDVPWPTLDSMRQSGRRLVVFSDRADGGPDWHMPVWEHCFETHWESFTAEQLLENKSGRGDADNALFIVNHFLTQPLNQKAASHNVNRTEFLEQRFGSARTIDRCPNFIVVDFYETGDWDDFTGPENADR